MVTSALEQTSISNEGPRYDAEYLKELKASTPNSRIYDPDMSIHPESRLVREEDELGEGDDGQLASTIHFICSWKFNCFDNRICGIHLCSGTYRARQEITQVGGEQTKK